MNVWASPIYKLRVPDPRDRTGTRLIEVVLDVTLSAPSFTEPSAAMKRVLPKVIQEHMPSDGKILDFGAGKLRNALYLLKRGLNVCGVEFGELEHTEFGKKAYAKAANYPKFWKLVYPNAFFVDTAKFDLALLINVLNVMPVPSERFLVIQECHKKLKQNGHVLWYSQHGDADYKRRCTPATRLGDGYFIGVKHRYKTFYREFGEAEMDSIMLANGFTFARAYTVPHNRVRLYRKSAINPFGTALTRADLQREIPRDASIESPTELKPKRIERAAGVVEVRPDPPALSAETKFIAELSKLPSGPKWAGDYHALVVAIFKHLFDRRFLRRIDKEVNLFGGRKRIDIMCRTGRDGFFASLHSDYEIKSPYIIVECKNYSRDIANPEFDQLLGRLGTRRGQFGMIICRKIDDRPSVIKRCKDANSGDLKLFVIVLDDSDLKVLLLARQAANWEAIDDYLDQRMEDILT